MLAAAPIAALREELAWLGSALAVRRDLDVLREHLESELSAIEPRDRRAGRALLRRLDRAREDARNKLLAALDDPRYLALVDRIEETIASPPAVESDMSLRDVAVRAFKKLGRTVEALPETPSDADLHAVRIKAKRARYAAELAAPEVGRPAARLVDRLKKLQDILGAHQDAAVAEARLRELAGEGTGRGTALVAGLLVERQRARRLAAREAFAEWWPKVQRRGRKAWR
jgi:CHAD domain-containing protein